jgi:hypothetical protein
VLSVQCSFLVAEAAETMAVMVVLVPMAVVVLVLVLASTERVVALTILVTPGELVSVRTERLLPVVALAQARTVQHRPQTLPVPAVQD